MRQAAERAKPRPNAEARLLREARRRRRITAAAGALALIVMVGGLAGAATLVGDDGGIKPAPGPEGAACKQPAYDVAVFPRDETTREELAALRDELESDDDVVSIRFVSAAAAYEEFKEYYADQPELWENLPEDALPSSFRVTLVDGADLKAALHRLRSLEHVNAVRAASEIASARPAPECSPESGPTFARYFFEVAEGEASASGVLEIDWRKETICLEVQARNIDAARLVLQLPRVFPRHADPEATSPLVLFTFFDTNDDSGSQLPPSGTHCFRHEQLGSQQSALDLLRRGTPSFVLTFHRGPNDEPGLVAELVPVGDEEELSDPLEASIEAQGGTVRLRVVPETIGNGKVTQIILANDSNARIGYGHGYSLEKHWAAGWEPVRRPANCEFTQELILMAPGDEISHPVGPYNRACAPIPLRSGIYRVSKSVELENGDGVRLTVPFEV